MRCTHLSKGHRGKNGECRQIASPFHLPPPLSPRGAAAPEGPPRGTGTLTALHKSVVCVFLSTSSFFHLLGGNHERVTLRYHKVHMQSCNLVGVFLVVFFPNYHRDGRTEGFWNPVDLSRTSSEKHFNVEDMLKSKRLKLFYKFTMGHFSFLFCSDKIS